MQRYRQDIDGLRAVAIIAVIFYHSFPKLAAGGFIGVDIFFVISGFLITQNIFYELASNSFKVHLFWIRRITRIIPALLVTLIGIVIAAKIILPNYEFMVLGKSIFGAASFSLNFLLIKESGYFDVAAITKPLIHLWSLAVEEQFYITWPVLIWIVYKLKIKILKILCVFGISSFLLNIYQTSYDPIISFYSPITRIWEFLMGAAVAWIYTSHSLNSNSCKFNFNFSEKNYLSDLFSLIGLIFILGSIFSMNPNQSYPGWRAFFPTAGAALIILSGPNSYLNKYLFSGKLLVACGLRSYSLYLWHWPLLSFCYTINNGMPSSLQIISYLLISLVLSIASFRYIETPMKKYKNNTKVAIALILSLAAIAIYGQDQYLSLKNYSQSFSETKSILNETSIKPFSMEKSNSRESQLNNIIMSESDIQEQRQKYWSGSSDLNYSTKSKKVIIYGDSIAWDIYKSLSHDDHLGLKIFRMGHFCTAFDEAKIGNEEKKDQCRNSFNMLLDSTELRKANVLIYSTYWQRDAEIDGSLQKYRENISKIRLVNPNIRIVFAGPKPLLGENWISINQMLKNYDPKTTLNAYLNSIRWRRDFETKYVSDISTALNVQFIDVDNVFCGKECPFYLENKFTYFDQNHWTDFGGEVFYRRLKMEKIYSSIFNN